MRGQSFLARGLTNLELSVNLPENINSMVAFAASCSSALFFKFSCDLIFFKLQENLNSDADEQAAANITIVAIFSGT